MDIEKLLERVYAKCVSVGDCMEWHGAVQSKCKSPTMRMPNDGRAVSLRRYLLEVSTGRKVFDTRVATYMCGNSKCVRLEHLGVITRTTLQERNESQFNAAQRLLKAKRISEKARARGKLNMEIAQEIAMSQESQRVLAKKFGVAQSTIGQIKRGITWQDYGPTFWRIAA